MVNSLSSVPYKINKDVLRYLNIYGIKNKILMNPVVIE